MATLSQSEIRDRFGPSAEEMKRRIDAFIRDRGKTPSPAQRRRLRQRLTAAKIAAAPGRDVSYQSVIAPWQVIYGRARIGGAITFLGTSNNNQYLHIVVTLAGHKITAIDNLYLDGERVVFGGDPDGRWSTQIVRADGSVLDAPGKVFMSVESLGDDNQAVNPDLASQIPSLWTADHRQRGRAFVYLILVADAAVFPGSIPDITFDVRGKPVYDPRSGLTAYSENPALCLADYLTTSRTVSYGAGLSYSDLVTSELEDAADKCDDVITVAGGGTETRYSLNGAFEVSMEPLAIIDAMRSAMDGTLVKEGDRWCIRAGQYRSSVTTLTQDDFLSSLTVTMSEGVEKNFNAVRGTFVDPTANWEESDFPPVLNAFYQAEDGGVRQFEDIQLPFTVSSATAQRLATRYLNRARQSLVVEGTFHVRTLQLQVGDTVAVTYDRFGWTSKEFEVLSVGAVLLGDEEGQILASALVLQETAAAIDNFLEGSEVTYDLAPNSGLPGIFSVETPASLAITSGTDELYRRLDGTIVTRAKLSWAAASDFFISSGGRVETRYKPSASGTWLAGPTVPGDSTFVHILDVQDGTAYDFGVRFVNGARQPGAWASLLSQTILGKTERPGNVATFNAVPTPSGVRLNWQAVLDLDLYGYILKRGGVGEPWETAQIINDEILATSYLDDIKVVGSYEYLVKALDTSGNESETAARAQVEITAPTAVTVKGRIEGQNLVLEWSESTGRFQITEYEIRVGTVFATAEPVATVKGLSYTLKPLFSGVRRYWVAARDLARNLGAATFVDIQVRPPSAVRDLRPEVIDNNVLLRFREPQIKDLPIEQYEFRVGSSYATAEIVGYTKSTFWVHFEVASGEYLYWVTPIDTSGNVGTPNSTKAVVDEPPDFELQDDVYLNPADGTANNVLIRDHEEVQQLRIATFQESQALIPNPMMGVQSAMKPITEVLAADNPLGLPSGDMLYRRIWNEMETSAGSYVWTELDAIMRKAKASGQTVNWRLISSDEANTAPNLFYLEAYAGANGYIYLAQDDGGSVDQWAPDFDNPVVRTRLTVFLTALAAHEIDGIPFAEHPNLGVIDVGIWGIYAEWHYSGCKIAPQASRTMGSGNSQIIIKAKDKGTAGNSKTCSIVVAGTNTPLSVDVTSSDVTINVATDGSGNPTTTANDAIAALYANGTFASNFRAHCGSGDGTGVLAAAGSANLSGGISGYSSSDVPHPSTESQQYIIDAVRTAFPNKKVIAILDTALTGIQHAVVTRSGGWRRDGLGNPYHMNTLYPGLYQNVPLWDAWKNGPVIEEPYGRISQQGGNWIANSWDVQAILNASLASHAMCFNSKNDYLKSKSVSYGLSLAEYQQMFVNYLRQLGYRFVLLSAEWPEYVSAGSTFQVKEKWKNAGVAKHVYGYRIAARLRRAGFNAPITLSDAAAWEPGNVEHSTSVPVPSYLPAGVYTLDIAVVEPRYKAPLNLAVTAPRTDKWVEVGPVEVRNSSPTVDARRYPGCRLYLTGGAGVISNQSLGTQAVNDDAVEEWRDQSGYEKHFEQLGSGLKPLLKTAGINGHPALQFDGSNDYLAGSLAARDIARSVVKVVVMTVVEWLTVPASDGVTASVFACGNGSTGTRFRDCSVHEDGIVKHNLGGTRLDTDSFVSFSDGAGHGTVKQLHVAAFDFLAGRVTLTVNGATVLDRSPWGTAGTTDNTWQRAIRLAASGGSSPGQYANIKLAEFAVFAQGALGDEMISDANVLELSQAWATKYGITLS